MEAICAHSYTHIETQLHGIVLPMKSESSARISHALPMETVFTRWAKWDKWVESKIRFLFVIYNVDAIAASTAAADAEFAVWN